MKIGWVLVVAVALIAAVDVQSGFAQFSGREILDNICKNVSRGRRDDQSDNTQKKRSRVDRAAPDSYDQTEHELALLEADLQLQSQQKEPWQLFAGKVSDYAGELSRERARIDVPGSERAPAGGLQHLKQLSDVARTRLSKLEEIRSAANKLYATLSPDQKKIADSRIVRMVAPLTAELSTGDAGSSDRNLGSATRARR
ncbi:MAG: Spy/CpxP family protein refolding chaperone [Alphaproteobacteria bacterium]